MNYSKPDSCAQCGCECCKRLPGSVHPDDVSQEQVAEMLASGRWAIDWWEGDPREDFDKNKELECAEYLRPAIKGMEGKRRDASWGGECTFLTPSGCSLHETKRPRECIDLEPGEGFGDSECHTHDWSKQKIAIAWISYQHWLEERS